MFNNTLYKKSLNPNEIVLESLNEDSNFINVDSKRNLNQTSKEDK
jgi:hypothetical protein